MHTSGQSYPSGPAANFVGRRALAFAFAVIPTRAKRSRGFVISRLTRISDWSPLTYQERDDTRAGSPFALCRGTPSGLRARRQHGLDEELDFAILVSVPPPFLPAGLLVLDGVPLVVHRFRPVRPLPSDADLLGPREPAIPSYLA